MTNRKQEEVICENCSNAFMKDSSEVKRNNKLGRKHFCGLSCSAKYHSVLTSKEVLEKWTLSDENKKHLENICTNRRDEYSPFRDYFRRVKRRSVSKGLVFDLTLDDLKEQWQRQKGICPYSGVKLKLPNGEKLPPNYMASLDRIDSNLWYVKGNIQYISTTTNYAKNDMSHEEMLSFCKIISEHWSK